MTGNLNVIWRYADPVDRWAAVREFVLRRRAWRIYLEAP